MTPDATRPNRSRGPRGRLLVLGAVVVVLGLATLTDTGCVLTTEGIYTRPVYYAYTCTASLNDFAGMAQSVSSDDAAFMNGRTLLACNPGGATAQQAAVDAFWPRFVATRTAEICAGTAPAEAALRARLCPARPLCGVEYTCRRGAASGGTCIVPSSTSPLAACSALPAPPGAPCIRVTPEAISYPDTPVGAEATGPTIHVTNGCGGRLVVQPPHLDAMGMMNADFPVTTDCRPDPGTAAEVAAGGAILGAGWRSECTIDARFLPADPGARAAVLRIFSNDMDPGRPPGRPVRVDLAGNGVAGTLEGAPNPACYNFAPDGAGCRQVRLTVSATGAAVRIQSPVAPAGYEIVGFEPAGAAFPYTLAAGGPPLGILVRTCAATPVAGIFVVNGNAASPLEIRLQPPSSGCVP